MAICCTLDFIGNISDFNSEHDANDKNQDHNPPQPSANQTPYIFITTHRTSKLPGNTERGSQCRLPILLQKMTKINSRVLKIYGKIYCIYDMSVYDPDGYDFTGTFDTTSCFGTLEFQYRNMLPKTPPRPDTYHPNKPLLPSFISSTYHNQGIDDYCSCRPVPDTFPD